MYGNKLNIFYKSFFSLPLKDNINSLLVDNSRQAKEKKLNMQHLNEENNIPKKPKKKRMPTNLILSEGNKYLRLFQFEKAITWYEMILQQNANHVQSLLGKAKCYMKLGRYEEAWTVFDKILKINSKCAEAINLKGMAEYLMGNFESSFITYWQGYQIQPFCDYLRLGYGLCKKAIENTLNAEKSMQLTEKDVLKLNNLLLKTDSDLSTDYNKNRQQISYIFSSDLQISCRYSEDLKLLADMCKDKTLTALHSTCTELFNYLQGRQKFWKMEDPYKTTDGSIFLKNDIYDTEQMSELIRSFALSKLALNERKTAICIDKSHEVLNLLNTIKEDFPRKNEIEAETFLYLVMSYLIDGDIKTAMKYCTELLNIINEKDTPNMKGKALRAFGEIYYKSNKYKDSLNFFLESLQFPINDEEKAAILYKISDCNIHLNNLKDAKDIAEKCLDIVISHHNLRFQFDALLLLAEIAVKGREMKLAEEYYKNALDIAIQSNDTRKKDLENLLDIIKAAEIAVKVREMKLSEEYYKNALVVMRELK